MKDGLHMQATRSHRKSPASSFAARAGRWSAQHRRAAIAGWLAVVVLALAASAVMPMNMLTGSQSAVGESGTAARAADEAFPQSAGETVLIQSRDLRASDPAFKAAVADVESRLRGLDGVRAVKGPYDTRPCPRTGIRRSSASSCAGMRWRPAWQSAPRARRWRP